MNNLINDFEKMSISKILFQYKVENKKEKVNGKVQR